MDEEDKLLSSILRIRRENISLVQHRSSSLLSMGTILGEEPASSLLCGFAFAFRSACRIFCTSLLTHILRADLWKFLFSCCSKFITSLFDPMRNSDPGVNVVSAQRHNSDLNSMFTVQITGLQLPIRAQFWCFLRSSLSVVILLLLLEECVHDKPLY